MGNEIIGASLKGDIDAKSAIRVCGDCKLIYPYTPEFVWLKICCFFADEALRARC
jgi:hypothetical protein